MKLLLLAALVVASCSSPAAPKAAQSQHPPSAVLELQRPDASATTHAAQPATTATPAADSPAVRLNPFGVPADLDDGADYFPGGKQNPAIATPSSVLQAPVGRRPAHHEEVVRLWRDWARTSPRVRVEVTGRTHEGRELLACVVTSERNMARLDEILGGLRRLADPRGLSDAEAKAIVDNSPAVAWMAYSIHGDEMSGVDGGLALAYQLIADQGADTQALIDDLVIVFDPMQNPDGRERYLGMIESSASKVLDLSDEGFTRGRWPYGRGNHYLFDMNRDWEAGIAPETRARWGALLKYVPQLFVDAHEMGSSDTFLFYPQAPPIHPDLPAMLLQWQKVFGDEVAKAFDAFGWSYYTREWADALGPFYSDSWGSLNGAIGILYEQARYAGTAVRRETGEIATYRDAVRHQLVASLSNLRSLQKHRSAVLADYLATRRANCDAQVPGRARSFVLRAGVQPSRERWLIENMLAQGIEVFQSSAELSASNTQNALGAKADSQKFPAGTWIIPAAQPQGALVRAFLNFDPRLSKSELLVERTELEAKGRSKMYDVTAWNLGQALGIDCSWADVSLEGATRIVQLPEATSGIIPAADKNQHVYAWAIEGGDDSAVRFAARALAAGLGVQASDEAFNAGGKRFSRGSLLVRGIENPDGDVAEQVERAARASGAKAFALTTARSPDDSADLGGQHFRALLVPRIALAGGAPSSAEGFGHVWHLIDRELGLPATLLDGSDLSGNDLRRYDVLVLPSGNFDLSSAADDLKAWVRSGGTLIAIEDSAVAVARESLGLSQVRERSNVLAELDVYAEAARREDDARKIEIDEAHVWGDTLPEKTTEAAATDEKKTEAPKPSKEELERADQFNRRFGPSGAVLRARVNSNAWITAGAENELPVFYSGSQVLLAKPPVQTAVRLAPAEELRLSGLVWPEARERLSRGAWLTVERVGRGQIILFATQPNFRCFWQSGARMLANAIVLGPGLGADALRRP